MRTRITLFAFHLGMAFYSAAFPANGSAFIRAYRRQRFFEKAVAKINIVPFPA